VVPGALPTDGPGVNSSIPGRVRVRLALSFVIGHYARVAIAGAHWGAVDANRAFLCADDPYWRSVTVKRLAWEHRIGAPTR
jgi:hypothetical protein